MLQIESKKLIYTETMIQFEMERFFGPSLDIISHNSQHSAITADKNIVHSDFVSATIENA